KPEAETTVTRLHMATFDTQILRRVRNIRLPWSDPVTNDSRTDHVGYELVALSVPEPDHRTRTAPTVDFLNHVTPSGSQQHFVLHEAGRPEKAHPFRLFSLIQASDQSHRILAEIS